jgi:hypothetical protein
MRTAKSAKPMSSAARAKSASGNDGGVDARPITTARRLAQKRRTNNAAAQRVNCDGESLHDDATVLLPSVSFASYQSREPGRAVSALGCYAVDLGVQVFAELANAYVNRRIHRAPSSRRAS